MTPRTRAILADCQNGEFDEFCEAEARQEQWDSDIREFEEFQNLARSNNQ